MKECNCNFCGSTYEKKHSRSYFCSWQCRFKSNYPKDAKKDDCWEWPKSRNVKSGYGQFNIQANPIIIDYAHRISYALSIGNDIPDGLFVLHKCDNPACFNPSHLSVGTHTDNMQDMSKKRRNKFGTNHHASKLNPEKILYIRSSNKTQDDLAEELGVCQGVISQVLRGLIWKHVE